MKGREKKVGDVYPASLLIQAQEKKSEKGFYLTMAIVFILMVAGILTGKFDRIFPTPENIDVSGWKQIQVQPQDTLWSIAKEAYGEKIDVRLVIDIVQEKNKISSPSRLLAGTIILIPAAMKYSWEKQMIYPEI